MTWIIIFLWLPLCVAVGMFASIRRNRSGFGWFLLALLLSPFLAFIFVAILQRRPEKALPSHDDLIIVERKKPLHPVLGILIAIAFTVATAIIGLMITGNFPAHAGL